MIPFLILLPHLKANLVNFNCGLTESKYIFEFNDAIRASTYPDLPSALDKYFVAAFAPENMQSHIPDDCRFKVDAGTFKVQFDDNRCGQMELTEDDSAQTIMTFYVYYYTLFNSATMVDSNGNINLDQYNNIIVMDAIPISCTLSEIELQSATINVQRTTVNLKATVDAALIQTKLAPKLEPSTETLKIGEDLSLSVETEALTNFKFVFKRCVAQNEDNTQEIVLLDNFCPATPYNNIMSLRKTDDKTLAFPAFRFSSSETIKFTCKAILKQSAPDCSAPSTTTSARKRREIEFNENIQKDGNGFKILP